jgi:hypothetical protein
MDNAQNCFLFFLNMNVPSFFLFTRISFIDNCAHDYATKHRNKCYMLFSGLWVHTDSGYNIKWIQCLYDITSSHDCEFFNAEDKELKIIIFL